MSGPLPVLREDGDILLCVKPVGISSEDGMPRLLCQQQGLQELFCVHRLDTAVGGVMVYAKTRAAAAALSGQIARRGMEKTYLAVCAGCPAESEGVMRDLLFKDSRSNRSFVVKRMRRGVKEAELSYRVLQSTAEKSASLVRVTLLTGRSHQIRVQFASRQMPLYGDGRYGSREKGCTVALWSHALAFVHPGSGEYVRAVVPPPAAWPWNLFNQ